MLNGTHSSVKAHRADKMNSKKTDYSEAAKRVLKKSANTKRRKFLNIKEICEHYI